MRFSKRSKTALLIVFMHTADPDLCYNEGGSIEINIAYLLIFKLALKNLVKYCNSIAS
jgi:hypothetical protein